MDYETIAQCISTMGFPIAVCLLCFWYINKKDSENNEKIDKMTEAINNNTNVISRLIDKLDERK